MTTSLLGASTWELLKIAKNVSSSWKTSQTKEPKKPLKVPVLPNGWLQSILSALFRLESRRLRGLVDCEYYHAVYPDVAAAKIDAVRHFLDSGWREARNPSSKFNTLWYLHTHTAATLAGINPLLHYLRSAEMSQGTPDETATSDWIGDAARNPALPPAVRYFAAGYDLLRRSPLFDQDFYRTQYPNVIGDPIEHYIRYGWRVGCDPGPGFSTRGYLDAYPDVIEDGGNPLIHFLKYGRREGRDPTPAPPSVGGDPKQSIASAVRKPSLGVSENHYRTQYLLQVDVAKGRRDPRFAPLALRSAPHSAGEPAILAFYLPQFHPIPENDQWWGKGFTEWTNVSKASPQFAGHYQPRLPGELGYYDLRLREVIARQIELAKHYGVSGFCFHYYWFGGRKLLEQPLEMFLTQTAEQYDLPFCLCWANENWTRRWDGSAQEILIEQNHTRDDHARVFEDLRRFFSDKRYIRVDGKPMVMVYRPAIIPHVLEMVEIWRKAAASAGLPGLYLVATNSFGFDYPHDIGFDAIGQFPPHAVHVGRVNDSTLHLLNPDFTGNVYDYGDAVDVNLKFLQRVGEERRCGAYFAGVMPGWDNEARKPSKGQVFHDSTPEKFWRWLDGAVEWSKANNPPGQRFVFVNAWNEWAEGAYLEPDRKFGYSYLAAVANVRAKGASNETALSVRATKLAESRRRKSNMVLCIHVYHEEAIEACADVIRKARTVAPFDVIISLPAHWTESAASKAIYSLDPVRIVLARYRGGDIEPFLNALRSAQELGYDLGCKLLFDKHTSCSQFVKTMIGDSYAIKSAVSKFVQDKSVGLAAPLGTMETWTRLSEIDKKAARGILSSIGLENLPLNDFVVPSMFWFRLSAMRKAMQLPIKFSDFEPDLDASDQTLAHCLDRLFPTIVVGAGFKVVNYATKSVASL